MSESVPRCPTCSWALADDQRYCVNCGQRLAGARELPAVAAAPPVAPRGVTRTRRTLPALVAVAAAFVAGILIGNSGTTTKTTPAAPVAAHTTPTAGQSAGERKTLSQPDQVVTP